MTIKYCRVRFTEWRDRAGDDAGAAASHRRCGSYGYQIINDANEMERLVDETGAALPAGAVYGYEVIDPDAPAPSWVGLV